jgi:hypothetical protein
MIVYFGGLALCDIQATIMGTHNSRTKSEFTLLKQKIQTHQILKPIEMKNPENKKGLNADQPSLSISATLCEPYLIKKLVERLAFRNHGKDIPANYSQDGSISNRRPLKLMSVETCALPAGLI